MLAYVSFIFLLCSKHVWLLKLGFLFVLCFLFRVFGLGLLNKSHAHMHVMSMRTQVKSCIRRHLLRNPNSNSLYCLVCLFCPILNLFPYVYMYLSLCLVCLFVSNVLVCRLGFYVHVLFKYHVMHSHTHS